MPKPDLRLFFDRPTMPEEADSAGNAGATAKPCQPVRFPISGDDECIEQTTADETSLRRRTECELDRLSGTSEAKTVAVSLGMIVPLLIDAFEGDRAWLRDFADEAVRIDADLYDVLLAYQQLRGSAAA